jgi:hypothetical protein
MAIERKDRSFDLIFDQVSMEHIPTDYILEIKFVLADGSEVVMSKDDLPLNDPNSNPIAAIMRDDVIDVSVKIDYEAIKSDVLNGVESFLGKHFVK